MEFVRQTLEDILAGLQPLIVQWKEERAHRVIDNLQ